MFDQLEIPHKFFQNWIVLRMLGIRDCVPLRRSKTGNLKPVATCYKLLVLVKYCYILHCTSYWYILG